MRGMISALSSWLTPASPAPHVARRSVDLVRVVVAIVLLTHPLHALVTPDDIRALAQALEARGLPLAGEIAWAAIAIQLVCGLALLVPRMAAVAAIGSIAVLAAGGALLYAPNWFVLGGAAEDGHPGLELNALLIGCLAGVLCASWPPDGARERADRGAQRGLEVIRIASAAVLVPHGAWAFVHWDVEGMHAWGDGMSRLGFPCGVALVWSIKSLELVSSVARLARRLIVPACFGNLLILVPGMWISQHWAWFDVGPGEGGIEYVVVLCAGAVACILAYWPARAQAGAPLAASPRAG
jgi:uncharacterized membrane protein YphA (DoxX/SURF4 family)